MLFFFLLVFSSCMVAPPLSVQAATRESDRATCSLSHTADDGVILLCWPSDDAQRESFNVDQSHS